MIKEIRTLISQNTILSLEVGDKVLLSGTIYAGRDAALPQIVKLYQENRLDEYGLNLDGAVVFHSAVSVAGIGPTSSNKVEIEHSIPILSRAGVRLHVGKGAISDETIYELDKNNSAFAVTPPVTALLEDRTIRKEIVAFPELGMEAFYKLEVQDFPMIIAAVNGKSIY